MNVQVHPYKQEKCFPSRILYANESRNGKISCPTFRNYKNATITQWYKVNKTMAVPAVDQITVGAICNQTKRALFYRTADLYRERDTACRILIFILQT